MILAFLFYGLLGNNVASTEKDCSCTALGNERTTNEHRTKHICGLAHKSACGFFGVMQETLQDLYALNNEAMVQPSDLYACSLNS